MRDFSNGLDKQIGRLYFLCWLLLGIGFTLLLLKFFKLQVVEHSTWKARADRQHWTQLQEPFQRGTIYANSNYVNSGVCLSGRGREVVLAQDVPTTHLFADPKAIPADKRRDIMSAILQILNPPLQEAKKLKKELARSSRSRRLVSWVSLSQKQQLLSWWYPFARRNQLATNALFFVGDYKRAHPQGRLLGQLLHTVQALRDEKTGVAVPTGGLELSLNKFLTGSRGLRRMERSPRHLLEAGDVITAPENGANVELTINHVLQAIAEEELEKAGQLYHAKSAWAIILDPFSGHVLALAQYPFFYPDEYTKYFSNPEQREWSKVKAVTDTNEPGSPTKAITLALALKANLVLKERGERALFDPFEKIDTSKGAFPGRKKAITDVNFHRCLNMYMGAQKSSNIYMATLASRIVNRLGDSWYRQQLALLGFGKCTGIELPGESAGVLPSPDKKHPNGRVEWSKATPYSLAMGYNLQTTSIQMACAFATFVNGGYLPKPTLIRKVWKVGPLGEEQILIDHRAVQPEQAFPKVLEAEVIAQVIKALKFVTKPGSSAAKADVHGYTEAGKTGTSMKLVNGAYSEKCHFASFIGFVPLSKNPLVIYIGIDEPRPGYVPGRGLNHRGAICAAPTFRNVATRVVNYLGIPPDDPKGYPKGDPRSNLQIADWMAEAECLQQLYEQWNKKEGNKKEGNKKEMSKPHVK